MLEVRACLVATMCVAVALPADAAEGRFQGQLVQAGDHQDTVPRTLVATGPQATIRDLRAIVPSSDQDARAVRRDLVDVMRKYPPSLGEILRLDPSLMSSASYLAPYPALQSFLAAHPDVVKNPSYYFDSFPTAGGYYEQDSPSQRLWHEILGGAAGLAVFATIVAVVSWLIRLLVDYRRWNRLAKVQADAHTKLLDRFTANDELIAYVQSPAGSRFLQSAPIALDPGTRRLGAPVSRILWSAQAGLVVMMAGIAFQYVSSRVDLDAQQPLFAIGVVALAVGVGFLLSAGVAYAISHRLGLFESLPPAPATPGASPNRQPEA
jgi:hypothetical protein